MKPAVIAKMCGTKIKYPTAKGDDVMTQVTDAMVEAAWTAFGYVRAWRDREDQAFKADGKPSMRAALEAALAVAEPPSPGEAVVAENATSHAALTAALHEYAARQSVYKCWWCKQWHWGHTPW